jgi:uncharacterized LabA/DUF88 family protein
MNAQGSICRIGVFYDGSYFSYAQRFFYHDRQIGWLSFQPLHAFLERFVSTKEQGFTSYKVVYASWHQGLFSCKDATEGQLRSDRHGYLDLLHAGVEPKYLPISETKEEKGVDVALAVDALQAGLDDKVDVVVVVSGDGDFVPLVRALNKQGIRAVAAYFNFTDKTGRKSFINERLFNSCNYRVDIAGLDKDREFQNSFKGLFRTADEWKNNEAEPQLEMATTNGTHHRR